tara:strand:+ start:360 stop:575 length:216 start_codon:yes stop_codon:yes gene_type:complete
LKYSIQKDIKQFVKKINEFQKRIRQIDQKFISSLFFMKSLEKRKKRFYFPQQKKFLVIFFGINKPEEHKVK